jgi:redox-regulated HSP33 family molecular chaperone
MVTAMHEKLIIEKVDRHKANWDPKTLFTGFKIRAVLVHQEDMITKINAKHQLQRRLKREMGEEGAEWILQTNPRTGEDELYLQNSGKLIMWKLQDVAKFNGLFEKVEQHKDNLDEVREDE